MCYSNDWQWFGISFGYLRGLSYLVYTPGNTEFISWKFHGNIFAVAIIWQHLNVAGRRHIYSWQRIEHLSCIVCSMTVGCIAMSGAKAASAMVMTWDPFCLYGITLTSACIGNYIHVEWNRYLQTIFQIMLYYPRPNSDTDTIRCIGTLVSRIHVCLVPQAKRN